MKKLYIQPVIEVEIIETPDLLAGSPHLEQDNFDDTPNEDPPVDPVVKPGGEGDFAKPGSGWGNWGIWGRGGFEEE